MDCLPDYAELHCLSNFSFLRGASHPEELVARAAALGYSALALTDEGTLAGVVRAHVAAKEHKLKLIVGSELRLEDGMRLTLLATDRRAYGTLCALITAGRRRGKKGAYVLTRSDVEASAGSGLLALLLEGDAHWLAAHFPARAWIASRMLLARKAISRSLTGGELMVSMTATESPKSLFRNDCVGLPAAGGRSGISPSLPRMSCHTSSAFRSVSKSST
jgi:error-prone DNA polymerase